MPTQTICRKCEDTGSIPVYQGEPEEPWRTLWIQAELKEPSKDGWHLVKCSDCNGTGKRKEAEV